MKHELAEAVSAAALKSAPPVAVVAASAGAGLTLQDWVYVLTCAYLVLQIGYLGWKAYREWKKGK